MTSVYVSEFTSPTEWTVVHDDHTSTIDPATVKHSTNPDGSPNCQLITLTCPVCGANSTHPVGGGAAPVSVQTMFVQIAERDGCCEGVLVAGQSTSAASDHVKEHVIAMDGEGRWQLDQVPA